ncbi:AbrB/MazE/SpoVT family DNA-binding domain-containing protein [Mesorhizobium sp. CO1-1-7]|uniref:Looped-hinge helix DNA binding domain, AbrB family n=1 Tax=Mesorhizobium australicum (strain HAMBI 3006 / LMG 24608 / WSM2073) TaxID=754035 RepID=L0KFM4_MESAW|nr:MULTISPECIES: AbrB/MazE/SpoVT family DNA-binding domain-containing protein [Mesorhizobium]AGB43791.1 looped-hinge helix DNA binding domain, AbrB family [Mesorhizobium australicum WSM2073]MBZ9679235.1 AbrB/MazE/SpoVT family DNA-binding domain-containing protein [Mesorhizobium sp. CO1-1-2]MBZ9695746.1 AbrB/MazE/SpoVT family DNA-binding domain-containing protein [Mesorhizobium sp. CO1-1-9]MBZ9727301.1 AbrB/MazE/SpoVT family DNA-binding domain-containing protein [Mesorhizobium sp. CO1-1-11]MBZ9
MRVTTKGQVTIPKPIRDHLGIGPGSEVEFVATEEGARLVAVNENLSDEEVARRFRNILHGMAGTLDLGGMTADAYMEWLRGPREDLDVD